MQNLMQRLARYAAVFLLAAGGTVAHANDFDDSTALFKGSNESASYFANSYGYALYPTVGEGGFVVAGAHGKGRVYTRGAHVGNSSITEVSVGFQAGAQAYSEIVFFENRAAFRKFTKGNYEFGAGVSAVVITAAAQASAGTTGVSAGASGGQHDAATKGSYTDGLAVFKIVKGGAMAQAAVAGQKFSYTPLRK